MLTLLSLKIERCVWPHKPEYGRHTGKATFDGDGGEISLTLTPEQVHRMLLVCADGIVGMAKEAATALVLEAQASIAKDAQPSIGGG